MRRQAESAKSRLGVCALSPQRLLLWGWVALVLQLLSTVGAKADAGWERYPSDAEIAELEKTVTEKCRQHMLSDQTRSVELGTIRAPTTPIVTRSIVIKRHDKSLLGKKMPSWLGKGDRFYSPLDASWLTIIAFAYQKFTPYGHVKPEWFVRGCQLGRLEFKSDRFFPTMLPYRLGGGREHFGGADLRIVDEHPESGGTLLTDPFKDPKNWPDVLFFTPGTPFYGVYRDPGFAPPGTPDPSNIKVCPPLPKSEAVGLIAANEGARAVIAYSGAPNKEVLAISESDVPDVKVELAASKDNFASADRNNPLRFKTDANGVAKILVRLRVYYWPEHTNKPPVLTKPGTVRVLLREEGAKAKEVTAEIKVGLGLTLETAKMIDVPGDQHVWRTVVKSRFFPELDMVEYWDSHVCHDGLPLPYVNVQSIALNFAERGDDSPLIDGVGGQEEDILPGSEVRKQVGQVYRFGRDPAGKVYLRPVTQDLKRRPAYGRNEDVYPAVVHRPEKNGRFAKSYFGFLKIAERGQPVTFSQRSLEPRVLNDERYAFIMDQPDTALTWVLCATDARDVGQMFFLSAMGLLPVIGDGVELSLGLVSGLCAASKGSYKDGLMAVGYAVGKAAFGQLVKELAIPKMTQGNWSPKFYRNLGIDPADMGPNEGKAFAEALRTAYDLAIKDLEAARWTPPKPERPVSAPPASGPRWPSAGPRWPSPKQK